MENCPDQVQTLAVLLSFAEGKSVITGVRSLRVKETERILALQSELLKMGIKTESTHDSLTIYGGEPKPAAIDTYNDHRMAMSFAVAGTALEGLVIKNPGVVTKTFPEFWKKLESLGVEIYEV
jgi:3-phosphoshikimate 1-carboxyvinyltransferase